MDEILESPIIQRAAVASIIGNPAAVELDFEMKTESHDHKIFRILFVAATLDAKYKGFNLFLEAISNLEMTEITENEIEVQIVGVGGSKILSTTDSRVKIIYQGALSSSEVHQLMAASDLLVVPSLTENYPGVIAEAQLLGCAVAASKVGGIPEMVEDGISGFLFEPNKSACKNAIIRAINSPNRMQIVDFAREVARARHDEGKINRDYEKLMERLIKL
jgi:glycosyltransferase involved in cell wall biosynthesis